MVVYYSQNGATRVYAQTLAELTNDSLFELRETAPRIGAFGMVRGAFEAILGIQTSLEAMPELPMSKPVFICSPVWAGRFAPAVLAFVKNTVLEKRKVNIILTCADITKGDAYKGKVTEQLLKRKCSPGFVQVFACDRKSPPEAATVRKHLKKLVLKVDETF